MSTKVEATIEDLYKVDGKAELVNGEIVHMSPTGLHPHYAALQIAISLQAYELATQSGFAVCDNVGFVVDLPHRESFSPDAAYYVAEDSEMKFARGAPVFAVEVRSEGDYGAGAEREMAAKRADYFAAGTQVVWDVDLRADNVVQVYCATNPQKPTVYRRGDMAHAEPAVPGWTMVVDDLFRKKRRQ